MANFLDYEGLAYYNDKLKAKFDAKADKSEVPTKTSELVNDSNFVTADNLPDGASASTTTPKVPADTGVVGTETSFARGDHQHPHDPKKLNTDGDGSNLTISFNVASGDDPIQSGETMSDIAGKIAKEINDLGDMAYKDTVTNDDLSPELKEAIQKAEDAMQDYTETDPTVPAWAKEATKPTYTAAEVGAIPASEASKYALKDDIGTVYKYKGSVAAIADLPSSGNEIGDVWNVEETDMNYGWTGTAWDPLGQPFQIEAISMADIDALMAGTSV